ncbi:MAG: HYR domain-containing protein [Saprospiraceae bacterium]|nr:HYR domain-containing protein [Saprospiraceae bacterium]MCF8251094.1 HYR domain-containing protein [Saprospiraceae bacterium]MCF8280996.1 HYR domain-containing protein [Bacteroidales bacterium]MCF8312948.1 HYR domain-containing protein [Saprospiraceae bacterium]MCF8441353.1 HYR domain-containing protein [Saprospiraceae bacterium]
MRKFEFTKPIKRIPFILRDASTSGLQGAGRLLRAAALMCLLVFASWGDSAFAQCALVCNDDLNVSLPGPSEYCTLEMTSDILLEDPSACAGPYTISLFTLQGLPLPSSPYVNASHIGHTYLYSVGEPGGNSCWGTISIEDKLGPQITMCSNHTITCLSNYKPTTDGGNVPTPTVYDCSGVASFSYTDVIDHGTCNSTYVAIIYRTWTAVDNLGYVSTCTQTIIVQRVTLANPIFTPVCPPIVELQCGIGPQSTAPSVTGYPMITVNGIAYPVKPGANNFCEIAASYTDDVVSICGGSTKILRTWTVYDWCLPTTPGNGNPWSCIQVIKKLDNTAPSITCPAPITQGSSSGGCYASFNLPAAVVFDSCSTFTVKVLTPFGIVNGNGGPILNVPVGTHTITYIATDACGNVGQCNTTMTVKDVTSPVAVCIQHTTVSLTDDGTAIVSATSFNNGSSDNCGIDHMFVSRMPSDCDVDGTPFDTFAPFSCCDIGELLMVSMRVYDAAGNFNTCMVEVEVQDKIDPTISCPPNKTIECADAVPAVSVPFFSDNCPNVTWTHTETNNVTNCGTGFIWREYTVTDASGRKASCTQTITVVNSFPFGLSNIDFPDDFTTDQCDPDLEPNDLPVGFDIPIITEDNCDLVAVTHTDQLLPINPPACFKILRKWIVIDWCQYNPNQPNSPGYWERTQVIKVQDNQAPVIACPGNITVSSLDANCGYGAVSVPALTATDCSNNLLWTVIIDFNSNGTPDQTGTSPNLSGNYPFGTHAVSVKVEDKCGNQSTCNFTITVVDGKKPSPICVNGLAVELMPMNGGGMIQLTPSMFNAGSFDNCTSSQNLAFEIVPSVFDCNNVGTNIVTMYVTDQAGNTDFCETYVIIQDNMVVCPAPLTASVSGNIANAGGSGMNGVTINVSGNGPLTAPSNTSVNGNFVFSNLSLSYDYTLTPNHNLAPMNGVSTYDLVLMTRHILNIQPLDSPYKIIAGDVNKNGSVTTADVVELRKLILQLIPTFPNNTSWRFIDKSYIFPNPANPFTQPFPEFFNINDLAASQNGVDFVAVKVGDVNGSAVTNFGGGNTSNRNLVGELDFVLDEMSIEPGQTYRVPFKASNFINLTGYQFALQFDPEALSLEDIEVGELEGLNESNFGLTMLEDGIITTSWDNSKNTLHDNNTVLFTLVFKANIKSNLSKMLQVSGTVIPAEAYRTAGQDVELLDVHLRFNNTEQTVVADDFELLQNNPNPFRETTAIGFRLPEAGKATLTVYDLSGKVLKTISEDFAKGYNEVILNQNELGAAGILFYQLETATQTATRRMVRL